VTTKGRARVRPFAYGGKAAGFRAVAFDQRGYSSGVRPVEVDAYGPEDLIGDVLAVADALGWSRFDLVGHDWGSAVGHLSSACARGSVREEAVRWENKAVSVRFMNCKG